MIGQKTVIITATEPRGSDLAHQNYGAHIIARALPLLSIKRLATTPAVPHDCDAVLITSAHALAGLAPRPLPLYAVGAYTADAARALGWETVIEGDGSVAALVKHADLQTHRHIFYPCAHDRAPLTDTLLATLPAQITFCVTYSTEPHTDFVNSFPPLTKTPFLMTIHSARAATLFASLVHTYGWHAHVQNGVCLSLSQSVLESLRTVPFRDIGTCAGASAVHLHAGIDQWARTGTVPHDVF